PRHGTMRPPFEITRLDTRQADVNAHLDGLLAWERVCDKAVTERGDEVIAAVRQHGDAAVVEYPARFDGLDVADMAALTLDRARLEQALERITAEQRQALEVAAERVRLYHEHQRQDSWRYAEADGTVPG